VTTYQPTPASSPPPNGDKRHKARVAVALWAGIAAFFGSLVTVGIFDVLSPDKWLEYFGAFLVAAITAGGVYAKERYEVAKRESAELEKPDDPA
jgi:cyclopropane fatty-acyl-phospholipid synthase-like methyltransferase